MRQGFLENRQALGGQIGLQVCQPCDVPTGPRETRHVTKANWVGMGREHDWDRLCRPSCRLYFSRRGREDNIDIRVGQLASKLMQQFDALCPTELDENVLAFDITQFSESRPHGTEAGCGGSSGAERQVADTRYFGRLLLRACRERPRRRSAAEQRDELAALHSITSSARPDKGRGTVMPSALAVLRLMISSTFVACRVGRSAGFSPLMIRPA